MKIIIFLMTTFGFSTHVFASFKFVEATFCEDNSIKNCANGHIPLHQKVHILDKKSDRFCIAKTQRHDTYSGEGPMMFDTTYLKLINNCKITPKNSSLIVYGEDINKYKHIKSQRTKISYDNFIKSIKNPSKTKTLIINAFVPRPKLKDIVLQKNSFDVLGNKKMLEIIEARTKTQSFSGPTFYIKDNSAISIGESKEVHVINLNDKNFLYTVYAWELTIYNEYLIKDDQLKKYINE